MTESRAWHQEIEGEAPFPLAEVVVLPSGQRLRGTRARVYTLLKQTAIEGVAHRIGAKVGPPGWVPNYYFRRAWSGGNAGDRRLRELRSKYGVTIEERPFGDGSTRLLRWVADPRPGDRIADSPRESRPVARNREMGGFRTETKGIQPVAPSDAAERLRFSTAVGRPPAGSETDVDLTPGAMALYPLSVPAWIHRALSGGQYLPPTAAAAYIEHLTQRREAVLAIAAGGGETTLWCDGAVIALGVDFLERAAEALVAAGAERVEKAQQQDDQRGAA